MKNVFRHIHKEKRIGHSRHTEEKAPGAPILESGEMPVGEKRLVDRGGLVRKKKGKGSVGGGGTLRPAPRKEEGLSVKKVAPDKPNGHTLCAQRRRVHSFEGLSLRRKKTSNYS